MSYTLITHFTSEDYQRIHKIIKKVNGRMCRVPYGRVDDDQRYKVDTLPYHLTVSSSKRHLLDVLDEMRGFSFHTFRLQINGVSEMNGKNGSKILYFSLSPSDDWDKLQTCVHGFLHNDKYIAGNQTPHITICISKDKEKIKRIRECIEDSFEPFDVHVTSLGLYSIWPGKMMSEYQLNRRMIDKIFAI